MKTAAAIRATRKRIRSRAVSNRPRLHLYRSQRFLSAQIIDDLHGQTVAAVHEKTTAGQNWQDRYRAMATKLVKLAREQKAVTVRLDTGKNAYHGRVAAFADDLRQAGLKF